MKKYRSVPAVVLLALGIILILIPSIPSYVGAIVLVLSALAIVFSSWGTFLFTQGSKAFTTKGKPDISKALTYYKKAYDRGLPDQYVVITGSITLQYGNIEEGKKMLESILNSKDKKIKFDALTSLSMYPWIKGNTKDAIKMAEEAKETGLKDRNLYINLGSYYLRDGKTKEFKLLLEECVRNKLDSAAMIDLQAECMILEKKWDNAGFLLETLFNKITPTYTDPYLHFILLYLHYGEINKALHYGELCKEKCLFSNTSSLTEESLDKLLSIIKSPYIYSLISSLNDDPSLFIKGEIPSFTEIKEKPEFPALPEFEKVKVKEEEFKEIDETLPNTTLSDEDEEWIKKHS